MYGSVQDKDGLECDMWLIRNTQQSGTKKSANDSVSTEIWMSSFLPIDSGLTHAKTQR